MFHVPSVLDVSKIDTSKSPIFSGGKVDKVKLQSQSLTLEFRVSTLKFAVVVLLYLAARWRPFPIHKVCYL